MGLNIADLEYAKFSSDFNAVVTTSVSHQEMHDGNHYFFKNVVDFVGGAAEVQYLMFRTPDSTKRVNANASLVASAAFEIEIYEAPTVSADGTPLTVFNNDRDSANVAGLTAFAGPTVTDDGLLIWRAKTGTGALPSTVSPNNSYEIIAKRNTMYIHKLTKTGAAAAYVDVDFWFYEHAPRGT